MARFPALQAAGLVALMAALLPFLALNSPVQLANLEVYDWLMWLRRPSTSAVIPQIVLLAVDDAAMARNGPLPLRRNFLAAGLVRLVPEPPKVLAVALTFPEETTKESDEALARVLTQFPRLVLGVEQDISEESAPWVMPLPALQVSNALFGHLHVSPDADGVVRAVALRQGDEETRFWALAVHAALLSLEEGSDLREYPDRLQIGPLGIPARAADSYSVWIRHAGSTGTFRTYSFLRLLDGTLDPQELAGKIVILGMTASGIGHEFLTPLEKSTPMSEIEVQANIVRALLDSDVVRPLDAKWEYSLLLAMAAVAISCVWWGQRRGLLLALAAGILAIPAGVYAALTLGWILPMVSLAVSFSTALLLAAVVSAKSTSPVLP